MIKDINIVPRWLILVLDLFLCSLALAIAHFMRKNFEPQLYDFPRLFKSIYFILIVNLFIFYNLKIYAGIIRYTGAQDSLRIIIAILLSVAVLALTKTIIDEINPTVFVSYTTITIYGMTSFAALLSYRMMAKYFFDYIKNIKLDVKNVIIYGVGETSVATKKTLDSDSQFNMRVVAFIDDDDRISGNVINNVKIYPSTDLEKIIVSESIDDLIITDPDYISNAKRKVIDICLDHKIRVLAVPKAKAWTNGTFKTNQIKNIRIEDLLERETIELEDNLVEAQIKGKRILVTGAAGSIGSEIVRQLAKFKPQLIILNDIAETALHDLQMEIQDNHLSDNFITYIGDVKNKERMENLFKTFKPHHIYHAAAYKHVPIMENNPSEAICNNVGGTKVIADLAVKFQAISFVMISTDKAVNPTNVMGASKRIAELYVQSFAHKDAKESQKESSKKTKFITTRFGNVLGSNGSVIPRFSEQIQKGGPITVTHPDVTRYFMTIPEACRLVLEAGAMGNGGEIYIFDMGSSVKIVELAKKMIKLSGLIPNQDIKIEFTGLRPGEKLYEELLNDRENTIATHHKKIMIAKVCPSNHSEVNEKITHLIDAAAHYGDEDVVRIMKKLVPEFISKNSVFETLDNPIDISI